MSSLDCQTIRSAAQALLAGAYALDSSPETISVHTAASQARSKAAVDRLTSTTAMMIFKQPRNCSMPACMQLQQPYSLLPAVRSRHSCRTWHPAAASGQSAAAAAGASRDDEPLQPPCTAVTVRPLQASDKDRWQELFRDYIAWYKASVPDDVIELCWQRLMEGGEGNHTGLVAYREHDSMVVGLAHVLFHRSTWCATHYCYLEDLYVDGKVRAQGVGQALIEAVYSLADERGAPKVYWQTHEQNYRARGLYDKMGRKSQFILYERTCKEDDRYLLTAE